jgi:hypothetical protein
MRGLAYLKEAGAEFTVQIVPMRDNYHQYDEMIDLSQSLGPHYRIGAAWLYLSASGARQRNSAIAHQRLDPREVIQLDQPDLSYEAWIIDKEEPACHRTVSNDFLFSECIATRGLSMLTLISDDLLFPSLRTHPCYNLRTGTFQEAWDDLFPPG